MLPPRPIISGPTACRLLFCEPTHFLPHTNRPPSVATVHLPLRCRPLLPCRCAVRRIHISHRERIVQHLRQLPYSLFVLGQGAPHRLPHPYSPYHLINARATMPPYYRSTDTYRPMHALTTRLPPTHSMASPPFHHRPPCSRPARCKFSTLHTHLCAHHRHTFIHHRSLPRKRPPQADLPQKADRVASRMGKRPDLKGINRMTDPYLMPSFLRRSFGTAFL